MATGTTDEIPGQQVEKVRFKSPATACPICGGWDGLKRHQSIRCYGYMFGTIAYCTRRDAGGRPQNGGNAYPHILAGRCDCGEIHDERPEVRARASRAAARSKKPFVTPPDEIDGYTLAAWYWYVDESGRPREWVFRYERTQEDGTTDKTFRQARVNESGLGEWTLGPDFQRVLYRLPQLLAADPAEPIYITEGEKGAEAAAAAGLVATTAPEGAGKWGQVNESAQQRWLAGRHIVILEDNDPDGQRHTAQIVASLESVAASLAVVRFPDKPRRYDIADWLHEGGDIADLPGMAQPIDTFDFPCETRNILAGDDVEIKDSVHRIAELERQLAAAKRKIGDQAQEIEALKQANRRMNEKLTYWSKVFEPGALKDSQKIEMFAVDHELLARPPEDTDGFRTISAEHIAKKTSHDAKTVGANLKRLEALGYLRLKPREFEGKDKLGRPVIKTVTMMAPGERYGTLPETWDDLTKDALGTKAPRGRGGKREGAGRKPKFCPECGRADIQTTLHSEHIVRRTYQCSCRTCGNKWNAGPYDEILPATDIEISADMEEEECSTPVPPPTDISIDGNCFRSVQPVNPNEPGNSYGKRVQQKMHEGLSFLEATTHVRAENQAYWDQREEAG